MTDTAHPTFSIGDTAKPRPEWPVDERNRVIPAGRVNRTAPFGQGQVLSVGNDRGWFLSGFFEKVEGA